MKNLVFAFVILLGTMLEACGGPTRTIETDPVVDSIEVVTDTVAMDTIVVADSIVADTIQ